MIRKRAFSTRWVELTMGGCLVFMVVRGGFAEVWTAAPAPTPPTITAPSGPTMLMPGETLTCTCTRGSDKDTLGGSACEPGVQYDDVMATNGDYPEWFASGGSWLNDNNKGTSVVWVAPADPGIYSIWVKDDDLPTAIIPPHTGSRNDAPASSAAQSELVLTITLGHDLWWFNGCDAANYYEQVTLTVTPNLSGTYNWSVAEGTGIIDFENDSDQQTVVNSNQVGIKSTGSSAIRDDVKVDLTVSGWSQGKGWKRFSVYTPRSMPPCMRYGVPWIEDESDARWGYVSLIMSKVLNQFDETLNFDVEWNEKWTSDIVADYEGMNWPRQNAGGIMILAWEDADEIKGADKDGKPAPNPTPQPPEPPPGEKVCHWSGECRIGSTDSGLGVLVRTLKWQKYLDRARHE